MYIPPTTTVVAQPEKRHNRVSWLMSGNDRNPSPPMDDMWTVRYFRFRKAMEAAAGDEDAERLVYSRYSAIYEAFLIYTLGDKPKADDDEEDMGRLSQQSVLRALIEAFIVADLHPYYIATSLLQRESVIRTYEKLFFDLREECRNTGFVFSVLCPEAAAGRITRHNLGVFFKFIVKQFGVDLLTKYCMQCSLSKEGLETLRNIAVSTMAWKTVVGSWTTDVNSYNFPEVVAAAGNVQESARAAKEVESQDGSPASLLLGSMRYVMKTTLPEYDTDSDGSDEDDQGDESATVELAESGK